MSLPPPCAVAARCTSRLEGPDRARAESRGTGAFRPLGRHGKPAGAGPLKPPGLDEAREQRPLDGPGEPLPHLVLMREDRGANADQHELGDRLLLIRFPRLVPHLIPARELTGVAMPAFAIVDRDVARYDGRDH